LLIEAIHQIWTGGDYTAFYDALSAAIDSIVDETHRKAIIAITDGKDNMSVSYTVDSIIAKAQASGIPIFIIGLGKGIDEASLFNITSSTGGHYYKAATASDLSEIYAQISDLLMLDQYVIQYDSTAIGNIELSLEVTDEGLQDADAKDFMACF